MSYDYENIEQIKQLKYRYCRGIDSCNIEELGRVFTEDARINYQGGSYTFEAKGKENILTAMKFAFHDKLVSCHTVHMLSLIHISEPTRPEPSRMPSSA